MPAAARLVSVGALIAFTNSSMSGSPSNSRSQDMGNVRLQFLAGLSKPDRMKMGFDQVAIGQFQRRRLNNPG